MHVVRCECFTLQPDERVKLSRFHTGDCVQAKQFRKSLFDGLASQLHGRSYATVSRERSRIG